MDFLEGVFLGPNFSDTIYHEKKTKWQRIVAAFIFYLSFSLFFRISIASSGIFLLLCVVAYLIMSFISPYLAYKYYEQNLALRFLIIFFQMAKKYFLILALVFLNLTILPFLELKEPRSFLENISQLFSGFFTFMITNFHIVGMILVAVILVAMLFFAFLIFLSLLYMLPNIVLFIGNKWQNLVDGLYTKGKK